MSALEYALVIAMVGVAAMALDAFLLRGRS